MSSCYHYFFLMLQLAIFVLAKPCRNSRGTYIAFQIIDIAL